ncbi:MAG: hypothetical protein B6I26_02705 [Desulfobacteraceae bacterium 4572_130]|nr:MAG: hypothetical protein B6I26_02705 [Desulfobacteraceae bacterium 4572_130]
MVDHIKESENIIMDIINSDFGSKYSLVSNIGDIEELAINNFSMIQKLISSGEAIIRMAPVSIDGTTFNIISTPFEKRLSTLYTVVMIIGPIIGIILSFMLSWYWLSLIVIAPIISIKFNKKAYLHALFNRAFNSEIIFSYLFTAGKITLELPEYGILYRNPA